MNRLFSILVSLFVLFLIYLWIDHISQSDKESHLEKTEQPSMRVPNDRKSKAIPKSSDPVVTDKVEQEPVEPPVQEKEVPVKPSVKDKVVASPVTHGAHLVVAGNFLERTNAEKHLKSIRELGYSNSEILNFEISQYYTVIAGRYDDLVEARRVAKKLKDMHSIDTYVRNAD